ncbi:hypothetical protein JQS43_00950 [Natronosporangium hydrolyticum]|uniref:Uncharacterized protein n=1 Tax=Natronosporangium hydrolyticum TaxID=2811111 RepID=A0A895YFV9_9ACTN|nr:hypothetical protein [Natronosporangium hydrolyticum]QSB14992.1 hypothetical protein JQS43_00950 [Natronosporangium hydrolyticum]
MAFAKVRPARSVLAATVVLGTVTAWLGHHQAPVPVAAADGAGIIPMWRLLAMAAAVIPVLALHSRLADLESAATHPFRAAQRTYVGVMTTGCAVTFLGITSIALDPPILVIMGRSWLSWCGLALLAGSLLGWRLAWTLPSLVTAGFIYWGYRGEGEYQWWEFSARPHDDVPSLLLSVALLAAGLAAYAATPWRRRRFRGIWRAARAVRPG